MNLFISRKLSAQSLFHSFEKKGIHVFDESLIEFTPIQFVKPETKWLFFYSKKGIKYYFDSYSYDKNQKYAVLGASSGEYFNTKTQHIPNFIGDNNSKNIAELITKKIDSDSITFIKAKNSLGSVEHYLDASTNHLALAIYNNKIKEGASIDKLNIPTCDVIVLTSPLNAEAWFAIQPFTNEKIIAIGSTTASKIESIVGNKVPYCQNPSEEDLFALVNEILSEN